MSGIEIGDLDFTAVQRAFSQARVEDFVRFVGRRLEERPDFKDYPFKDAWYILVGEYGTLATREPVYAMPDDRPEADWHAETQTDVEAEARLDALSAPERHDDGRD